MTQTPFFPHSFYFLDIYKTSMSIFDACSLIYTNFTLYVQSFFLVTENKPVFTDNCYGPLCETDN